MNAQREIGEFFLSLVKAQPTPYSERAGDAQLAVQRLLRALDNPEQALPCVHIAGSKGKGTTALFAEALLAAHGRKTGVFLSPHLQRWNERFRVNKKETDDDTLLEVVARLRETVHSAGLDVCEPTVSFFDALTACAFELFSKARVELGIMETGIGGRFDATRVCLAAATCITSIELEHTDKLGNSIIDIAGHKAGIAKHGVPMVLGYVPAAARHVIAEHCAEMGAPLHAAGIDFMVSTHTHGRHTDLRIEDSVLDRPLEVTLAVSSPELATNAAVAVHTVALLPECPLPLSADVVAEALGKTELPGRLELLQTCPTVVIDGAHTHQSALILTRFLKTLDFSRLTLVFSMTRGKRVEDTLSVLLPHCHRLVLTQADSQRSMPVDQLAVQVQALNPSIPVDIEAAITVAIERCYENLRDDEALCVTGSVYAAGAARSLLGNAATRTPYSEAALRNQCHK